MSHFLWHHGLSSLQPIALANRVSPLARGLFAPLLVCLSKRIDVQSFGSSLTDAISTNWTFSLLWKIHLKTRFLARPCFHRRCCFSEVLALLEYSTALPHCRVPSRQQTRTNATRYLVRARPFSRNNKHRFTSVSGGQSFTQRPYQAPEDYRDLRTVG